MKTKKLLATTLLALALGLVGCGSDDNGEGDNGGNQVEPCEKHTWGSYTTVKEATCTEPGSKERVCTVCGAKDEAKEIPVANHKYAEYAGDATHVPVTANCGQEGKSFKKCSVCNDIKEETTPRTAHNFGDAAEQPTKTGCNTPTKIASCPDCNAVKVSWKATDIDAAISSSDNTISATNGSVKFGDTPLNKNGAANSGSYIGYTVYSPAAVDNAVLSFRIKTHNQGKQVFAADSSDTGKGYILDPTSGDYREASHRYLLTVNDQVVSLGEDTTPDEASKEAWFDFPCTVKLQKGANKIVLNRTGGYRAEMYEFGLTFDYAQHKVDEHV